MFNPLKTLFCAATFATAVLAQSIFITQPASNTNVTAGSSITVQLDKPSALTGSQDVSVVIGVFPCSEECPGADQVLGDVLYTGSYDPQYYPDYYYPYQNFTITVPSWYSGPIQLGIAHFYLLGAGLSAQLQTTNTTLNVYSASD